MLQCIESFCSMPLILLSWFLSQHSLSAEIQFIDHNFCQGHSLLKVQTGTTTRLKAFILAPELTHRIFFPITSTASMCCLFKKYFCFALYLIAGEIPTSFWSVSDQFLLISFSGLFPFPLLSTWCMHSSQFLYPYPVIYSHFMTTRPVMAGRQILLELVFQISHKPLKIQVYF